MRWLLLVAVAFAGEAELQEIEEAVEDAAEAAEDSAREMRGLAAFVMDRHLEAADYALPGWEQPELDQYLAAGAPPSFLPLESIRRAVGDKKCPEKVLEDYETWLALREEEEAETESTVLTPASEVTVEPLP